MAENLLVGLSAIIILGIFAQWVSWIFKFPSILLLLIFGFLAGPVTGILNPDEVFGDLLFPFVSISVAIILFEGGLSLKLKNLMDVLGIVRNLITVGTLVTWVLSSVAAYYFLNLSLGLAILLGAILVVTGPTVIMPLLRLVKPKGDINAILKWEGIVNDPIGAVLALLVFDVLISTGVKEATLTTVIVIVKTIVFSSIIGVAGAFILIYLIKKDYIPDYLQNPAALATILLVFSSSNLAQHESGLFAVTLMGIILGNQKQVVIEHIVEFKENLGVLLLSVLFIILAARLQPSDLDYLNFGSILFALSLILVIRPVTIFLSTLGSHITWKEKLYLSWMAPRGIVAAAVTSIFAIDLIDHGYEEAKILVPVMFLVIISTILVYGLSAIPLAKILKLSDPNPQGLLIAGINNLSIQIHNVLKKFNIRVLLVDKNWDKVTSARQGGAEAEFGSIVSEKTTETISLNGIGRFIALTSNKGINSLATIHFSKVFESANVYQINTAPKHNQSMGKELRGHFFSSEKLTFPELLNFDNSIEVKANNITKEFTYEKLLEKYNYGFIHPLFILGRDKKLRVISEKSNKIPTEGETLISLIFPQNDRSDNEGEHNNA